MAQHTPYQNRTDEPIYIGFDHPKRRRWNGLGLAGFVVSLLGVPTLGILSPIGLFLSLLGLARGPRGFALTGTFLGLLGTAFWGLILYAVISANHAEHQRRAHHHKRSQTIERMVEVDHEINEFIIDHKGELPDEIEGNRFAVQKKDAWGNELQYEPGSDGYTLISSGHDAKFGTRDDVKNKFSYKVKQKAPSQYLISVN